MKTIGILGGMGPESTVRFYQKIITECQKQYGAKYDQDYPEIFLYSLPIADVVEKENDVLSELVEGVKKLEMIGVDFIVIPCNTVSVFISELRKIVSVPILSIVEETVKAVEGKQIGLLATKATIQNGIYKNDNFKLVIPDIDITAIITNIMAGRKTAKDKERLKLAINRIEQNGAKEVILGCTDLPLLINQEDVEIKLLDSLSIYAKATIEYAK